MPTDFSIEAIASIISIVVSIVLFILENNRNSNKKRKGLIQYTKSVTELVHPEAVNVISMSVDNKILIDIKSLKSRKTKKTSLPVTRAYKYTLNLTNTGTDDLENPGIDISFDDTAHVCTPKISSKDIPDDQINVDPQSVSHLRVTPNYLNMGKSFTLNIVTINNKDSVCVLRPVGKGLNLEEKKPESSDNILRIAFFIAIAVSLLILTAILFNQFMLPWLMNTTSFLIKS